MPIVEKGKQLASFADIFMLVREGGKLEITKDIATSPGKVILSSKSRYHSTDYTQLKQYEKEGFHT